MKSIVEKEVSEILKFMGGKDNIVDVTHCVTRLRFIVRDNKKVDFSSIEKLDGVMAAQFSGGQAQVVIGSKVEEYYRTVVDKIGDKQFENSEKDGRKEEGIFSRFLSGLAEILTPSLPAIVGGGMVKAFLFMFVGFGWIDPDSTLHLMLTIASDAMYYFFPFLLSVSAAEKFKTNKYMALTMAGVIMYPSFLNMAVAGDVTKLFLFDFIPIPVVNYSSSVVPIILIVWLLKYVYEFFQKRLPEAINLVFTPLLTLAILVPVSFAAIAPIGYYIGEFVGLMVNKILGISPFLSAFIIAGFRPLFVLTGVHHTLRPLKQQEFATNGYTVLGMMEIMSTIAQATAALAMYVILKDKKEKQIALTATTSGYLGITEPALYGVLIKYKSSMWAAVIGGGLGAAVTALLGGRSYAPVMASVLSIPVLVGDGFIGSIIGLITTVIVTFVIAYVFGKKDIKDMENTENIIITDDVIVSNPVKGDIIPITSISDTVFAQELLGKSIAINPANGIIVAPFDGEVVALYKSKHAIGLVSTNGIEMLIHIGIDTVHLEGKHFTSFIEQGDKFVRGDKLMEFNIEGIVEDGFNPVVICSITNSDELKSVIKTTKKEIGNMNDLFIVEV